jgi:hypothetical protein
MLSYRAHLAKIGIPAGAAVSYKAFYSRPKSLRVAMRSMNAPATESWTQVSDIFRDDFWTDEVQGVAWNGSHWIFSANANQSKPGHEDKAIYVFAGGATLGDGNWTTRIKYKDVPHPIAGLHESDDHWGQVTYYQGRIYVSHWWAGGPISGASVVVFKCSGGSLSFERWIALDRPKSQVDGRQERAEFQAINPWDGMFYTCFGGGDIHEFFKHDPETGKFTGEALRLKTPITQVQGACFSPNGHLYIASNSTMPGDDEYQTIWYYSALNGHRFGVIPVLAEERMPEQELEGLCHATVQVPGGAAAQIHAVLLENPWGEAALDNIFFKSFATTTPDDV